MKLKKKIFQGQFKYQTTSNREFSKAKHFQFVCFPFLEIARGLQPACAEMPQNWGPRAREKVGEQWAGISLSGSRDLPGSERGGCPTGFWEFGLPLAMFRGALPVQGEQVRLWPLSPCLIPGHTKCRRSVRSLEDCKLTAPRSVFFSGTR